jgi:hypothetical protein
VGGFAKLEVSPALVLWRDKDVDDKPEEAVPYGEGNDPVIGTVILDRCQQLLAKALG